MPFRIAEPVSLEDRLGLEGTFGLGLPRVAFVAVTLVVLPGIDVAWGGLDPLWQELGGSASGDGLSKASNPRRAFEARV
jgi:hypothetical protein